MTAQPVHAQAMPRRYRRRSQLLAVLAGATLLLAGCATGQRAQTAVEVPVVDGVTANIGQIGLRALTIASPASGSYAAGSSATVSVYIVNLGADDQLVSVSSPAAKSTGVFANSTAAFAVATSSAPASAAPAATGGGIKLASGETTIVGVTATQPQIVLSGLTNALYPAMSVPMTFTFANAGSVTVQVSVHLSSGPVTAPTLPTTQETDG